MRDFDNKFVVIRNDRNQPRKMWHKTWEIWERFSKDKEDVLFIAKTLPHDMAGTDLIKEVKEHNIENSVIFNEDSVTPEYLNILYNLGDVFLSTTGSEGFGLALAEACSAGLPVIATGSDPIKEILNYGKNGRLLKVIQSIYNDKMCTYYDEVDVDHGVACLEEFYKDWKTGGNKIKEIGMQARQYIISRYDVNKIVGEWDKMFQSVIKNKDVQEQVQAQVKETLNDRLEVAIVTKDRHAHLAALLTSLLNQTYTNFDIHIMDNSGNETLVQNDLVMKLLNLLGDKGHIWKLWKNDSKSNCHDALWKVVQNTTNKFVYRADDDIILDINCLSEMMKCIKEKEDIGAVGPIYNQGKLDESDFVSSIAHIEDNTQWHKIKTNIEVEHLHSGFLFKKELFGHIEGLSPLAFREDTLSSFKIKKKGYKLIVVKDALAYHMIAQSGNRGINGEERNRMAFNDETIFRQQLDILNKI